jgi:catechol 2,3-dioxygenase-like lactoylglutathione lyase family enzyme
VSHIKGIGGAFIDSNNAERLSLWYESILGIHLEGHEKGYYRVFPHIDVESGVTRENPVFAINQTDEPLPEKNRGFTINFRVDQLDKFLSTLTEKGVEQDRKMIEWERGKHAWIRDPDGNLIELYEELRP